MTLVCVHILILDIRTSNESCSDDKCSMAPDISLESLSVEVCIQKSVFAVADMVTLAQSSHHYSCRPLLDP